MDMKISGAGTVGSGEYDNVRISGSGRSEGLVRCKSLHASGAYSGESVECEEEFHVSGSAKLSGDLCAGSVGISGSFGCNGSMTAKETISASGSFSCGKNIKCAILKIAGSVKTGGDIEAETAEIYGGVNCKGLINAEELGIHLGGNGKVRANSIGGSKITVESRSNYHPGIIGKLFGWNEGGMLIVEESIEGDDISLENTNAKAVIGRNISIGKNCKIDLVQYSGEAIISPDAQIGSVEKI